jgi:hypothetical protein
MARTSSSSVSVSKPGARSFSPPTASAPANLSKGAIRCKKKFLRFFPGGFTDETYIDWERGYKWTAHEQWQQQLSDAEMRRLIAANNFAEVAVRAVRIESRTNLLFSFEKMALRDAVKPPEGARAFSTGLYEFLYGAGTAAQKFEKWTQVVGELPRKQTRVLTWPVVTVFGFIAQPESHFFLKPMVTKRAAAEYGYDFHYKSRPNSDSYAHLLEFAGKVRRDLRDMKPRDLIDIQSFLWVQGSDEYEE